MIKQFISLAFAVMLAVSVSAQSVQFGIRGGLNISCESKQIYANLIYSGTKMRVGGHVGAVANIQLNDDFDIEADLIYSMQGYKDIIYTTAEDQNRSKTNHTVTSPYINIPVSLKYYVTDGLYLECGPQVGYLLGKSDKLDGADMENTIEYSSTKKLDFSLLAGVGYVFGNNVFVSGRYIHGFTDTSKIYSGGKNRNIQFSVGYLF